MGTRRGGGRKGSEDKSGTVHVLWGRWKGRWSKLGVSNQRWDGHLRRIEGRHPRPLRSTQATPAGKSCLPRPLRKVLGVATVEAFGVHGERRRGLESKHMP